jgi:plasmid stabilization system protein ParE
VTLPLALSPRAQADLDEASAWYDEQLLGLGEVFVRRVDACLARIRETPRAFPTVFGSVRYARVARFPYGVYFRVQAYRIEVVAVWHGRRDPRGWQQRL